MLLVYLLLFLHLSSSVCEASSRNHRLVLRTAGRIPAAPASSTMTMYRRLLRAPMQQHSSASSSSHDQEHVRGMIAMQQQQGPSPSPQPGVTLARDAVQEGSVPPAEQDMVMPPPPGDDSGDKEAAGGGDAVGSDGGSSDLITDDQPESDAVDIGVDYVPPKTHPPSHN
ncbi:uncharacterized protein [Triticum aestivum]|uniref:uncharacterized protein n=1 Tax=Triticum aestivum TaxID=4565 RepID=UPI001D019F86|nr:uncharacterized protein LOC123164043 [Triticum aestivum]